MKPEKLAVALVIKEKNREDFVIVQRPYNDPDLSGVWGLPASSLREKETFEEAGVRTGKEKLGVELRIGNLINKGSIERECFMLSMQEFEAEIRKGEVSVPQPVSGMTQYTEWRWGKLEDLIPAAKAGSLCSRLYLQSQGQPF